MASSSNCQHQSIEPKFRKVSRKQEKDPDPKAQPDTHEMRVGLRLRRKPRQVQHTTGVDDPPHAEVQQIRRRCRKPSPRAMREASAKVFEQQHKDCDKIPRLSITGTRGRSTRLRPGTHNIHANNTMANATGTQVESPKALANETPATTAHKTRRGALRSFAIHTSRNPSRQQTRPAT